MQTIASIGHSNRSLADLFRLLKMHHIEELVDVRSNPQSAIAPQFGRESLEAACEIAGIRYAYGGDELGGRPSSGAFYDGDGYVLYWKIADSPAFQARITQLASRSARVRTAVMCTEENPVFCHRRLLVGRALSNSGIQMEHIRADGRLQSEQELEREAQANGEFVQEALVASENVWRSIRSVSRQRPPKSSFGS